MKQWILGGVSAAALVAGADAGWSLTAQQAWENWKTAAESYGQTLSSSGEATMDGKLTVSGVTLTADFDEMTATGTIEEVVFSEQSDGSVAITMSESFPFVVSGIDEAGDKVNVVVTISQPGMVMSASDAGGATAFSYESPAISVQVDELSLNDQTVPLDLSATASAVEGAYTLDGTAPGSVESNFGAASATLDLDMQDPEGDGTIKVNATVADIASQTSGRNMDMSMSDDMAQMLAAGFQSRGSGTYGPVTFAFDFQDGSETAMASGSLTGGQAEFGIDASGMVYDVAYEGLDVTVSGSDIPLPQITAQAGRSATTFQIPVQPSETASPFAMKMALEDLSVGEEIWSMFDPGAVLPRDPATLIVDLAGTGRWLVDIFDETAMMGTELPGELEDLSLNALKLAIGGAELTGEGAFTFDNSDTSTFDGVPRPEGKAGFKLVGGNALIDNLAKMGLIPQDQVMMVRMMTGMFAKPGAGPDELVSEIVIDGSGKLLINGAPMPF
ncbi:DUF2125 domain-containing protein [Tropicimonas marinistellae]|uniref:DUF2125 domain-containing protein n=1 Tax=Tropicimonas marinistellae TaxID=1739787 RepID=UPI0008321C2B|nr:DUF2125 domain-containing protein [Tropicimonas marinistellae]